MEEMILALVAKFPIAAMVYGILSGAYAIFCAVAAWTSTKKDDEWAVVLKRFFSKG